MIGENIQLILKNIKVLSLIKTFFVEEGQFCKKVLAMKITRDSFIQELEQYIAQHERKANALLILTENELQHRPQDGGWTALECFEHLNQYGRYYIPEMKIAISKYKGAESEYFQPGWIGNYFAQVMLPTANKKMKAMKSYNPKGKLLGKEVVEEFIKQQKELKEILDLCKHTNLTKIKCNISLTSFLKLRLGDTFRVVVYHNERHVLQAEKAVQKEFNIVPENLNLSNLAR